MRQTIAIVILSVLVVVLSGCDKIKTELERRHLGAESYKQTAKVDNSFDDKRNNPEVPSARKQIIIRIDLPMEEKLQIRMIKLPVAEEKNNDVVNSPNESLKEDAPRADIPQSKDEKAVVPDKKSTKKLEAPKSEVPKTEIKTDVEQEPKSEMKTDREESLPDVVPAPAPKVVVPAKEATLPPVSPDIHEMSALSQFVKSNPAPASACPLEQEDKVLLPKKPDLALPASNQEPTLSPAVASALTASPPETIVPSTSKPLKAPLETAKPSSPEPWALPNAEYPLSYY